MHVHRSGINSLFKRLISHETWKWRTNEKNEKAQEQHSLLARYYNKNDNGLISAIHIA